MKTLFVYYCADASLAELFHGAEHNDIDVFQIEEKYTRSGSKALYYAMCGRGVPINEFRADLSEYDSVVLACTLAGSMPDPAMNEFLHRTNLRGIDVSCLLIHSGKPSRRAAQTMRKRIFLAGGVCRGVVTLPAAELRRHTENTGEYIVKRVRAEA